MSEKQRIFSREQTALYVMSPMSVNSMSRLKTTETLRQTLTAWHNRELPHWYRHLQYQTTEHCHICTGTYSITQLNTAVLEQALRVSNNRTLPYWYRHTQYHTTEHCHIGTGTHSITQQSTATLLQALTVSHNRALPRWYRQSEYHTT